MLGSYENFPKYLYLLRFLAHPGHSKIFLNKTIRRWFFFHTWWLPRPVLHPLIHGWLYIIYPCPFDIQHSIRLPSLYLLSHSLPISHSAFQPFACVCMPVCLPDLVLFHLPLSFFPLSSINCTTSDLPNFSPYPCYFLRVSNCTLHNCLHSFVVPIRVANNLSNSPTNELLKLLCIYKWFQKGIGNLVV